MGFFDSLFSFGKKNTKKLKTNKRTRKNKTKQRRTKRKNYRGG